MFFSGKSTIISSIKQQRKVMYKSLTFLLTMRRSVHVCHPCNAVTHPPSHLEQINVNVIVFYIVKPEHFAYSHLLLTMYQRFPQTVFTVLLLPQNHTYTWN